MLDNDDAWELILFLLPIPVVCRTVRLVSREMLTRARAWPGAKACAQKQRVVRAIAYIADAAIEDRAGRFEHVFGRVFHRYALADECWQIMMWRCRRVRVGDPRAQRPRGCAPPGRRWSYVQKCWIKANTYENGQFAFVPVVE